MRNISSFALGVALALVTIGGASLIPTPAVAKSEKQKAPKLGKEVATALAEAQKLQQAGDLQGAAGKASAGLTVAKTDEEKFWAGQILYNVAAAKKDEDRKSTRLKYSH